jgi:DNA-binding transcriptional LysR family regulator
MHYTLNQLQVFLKVAQTQSVTKAAEQLHLTQPAVSIQLKNFQAQFDIPLTEVVGRKIYITEFGKEIAEAASEIINQVNGINQKTLQYKGQLAGRLKISIVSTAKYVMPYFLSEFLGGKSFAATSGPFAVAEGSRAISLQAVVLGGSTLRMFEK